MEEFVVLVNEQDEEVGLQEKFLAHKEGVLHRAFSIFLFNSQKEMLLHKRAKEKYHCPGLWTNACCSHPRKGETVEVAAHRRMKEELGFDCSLKKGFTFMYRVGLPNGLIEHEFDHVFIGTYDGAINTYNPEEIEECRWITFEALQREIKANPNHFTPWFLIALQYYLKMGKTPISAEL